VQVDPLLVVIAAVDGECPAESLCRLAALWAEALDVYLLEDDVVLPRLGQADRRLLRHEDSDPG
jgi:hypothetical protein